MAGAAQRFASPTGTPEASCSEADPCDIATAISGAAAVDEVIVEPGQHVIGATVTVPPSVDVRGRDGAARPRIESPPAGSTLIAMPGSTLRHLHVVNANSGSFAVSAEGSSLDRLRVESSAGSEGAAVELGSAATMSNSMITGNADGVYVQNAPVVANVVNSTVIVDRNAISLDALSDITQLNVRNTIARGDTDIRARAMAIPATVTVSNSNFRPDAVDDPLIDPATVVDAGFNQSTDPLFEPGGDFRQASGSPTIDKGALPIFPLVDPRDFEGEPRLAGLFPDIGADELVPQSPIVFTGDPGEVSGNAASVSGTVNPNGQPTTWRFEYGLTPLYGSSTEQQALPASSAPVPVSAQLTQLRPGTIVHYRLVAENAGGTAAGLDRILVVPLDPSLPPPPPPPGGGPQIVGLELPANPVVGAPIVLTVQTRDADDAVNGIQVDFDEEEGVIMRSACRVPRDGEEPDSGPFAPDRTRTFNVPYEFRAPGVHQVTITLFSGGCIGTPRTSTEVITILAMPPVSAKRVSADTRGAGRGEATLAATCRGADASPTRRNKKRLARATLCLVNAERRANGLRRLRWNKKLARAARRHNKDMHSRTYLAHEGPGGPNLGSRLRRARYRAGGGENIGVGSGEYGTPRGMVSGWMNSPTHRANILFPRFKALGVNLRPSKPLPPNVPGATYVANFGTRRR